MRVSVAFGLLLLGIAFPLLLNGQTFSNSLLGLALTSVAVALAFGPARDPQAPPIRRWMARIVVALGAVLLAALVTQLPGAYRFQAAFNRRVQEVRRGALPSTRGMR